jgi:hypothetical protein
VSDAEGWTIQGNRAARAAVYDRTSRGLQNRYIYGESTRRATPPPGGLRPRLLAEVVLGLMATVHGLWYQGAMTS